MVKSKRLKIKICLLGDPAVGKTSLIQKFIYNFFGDTYMRTLGTKVSRKVVHLHDATEDIDYEITMMVWDIMGQKFSSLPLDKYLRMSQGALIVCDITRRETFKSLRNWRESINKEAGEVPVIYLANKIDLEENLAFSKAEFEKFSENEKIPYYYTSAKTGENVDAAFKKLGEFIVASIKGLLKPLPSPPPGELVSTTNISAPVNVGVNDSIQPGPGVTPIISEQVAGNQPAAQVEEVVKQPELTEKLEVKPGLGYIIKEERPERCFKIFKELLDKDVSGICITRTHPQRIKEEYQLDNIPIYWLSSDAPNKKDVVVPTFLPQLNTIIIDYIQKYKNVVILLEGIEYLIDQNDFKAVLNLIHSLNDYIMGSQARLIIPINPHILKDRELHMLGRDFIFI